MDDPWGSPWAATDSQDKSATSPAKSDLAPPPRAFLSASSSPRITAAPDQSPWAGDDDGFGEWATTSDTPPVQAVWAGGWGASSQNLALTPRDDALSKASPIAWPGALATPKPANGSVIRHPSPDPWASEFATRKLSSDGASTPRLVVDVASPVDAPIDRVEGNGLGVVVDPAWDAPDAVKKNEQIIIPRPDPDPISSDGNPRGSTEEQPEPEPTSDSDVRASVDSSAQPREGQSPTPSNDNTDHEDEQQDSPITSIDEEPRAPRLGSRKASGKVQELVVKFDGLARAESQERVPTQRGRSRSPLTVKKRGALDDTADFGDFEDADEDEPPIPLETPAEPQTGEKSEVADRPVTHAPAYKSDGPSPIAQFGPMNFDADLALVSELFEEAISKAESDIEADYEVPDHVISDSFTEISERKTWYRISRLGSSRRHNAADDDSYRRVAWRASTVHDDTIKIVRRWMEEDSIAGRVTLGGGISKTQKNMFGWDSSAEPVTLDAIFGKRMPHSRASSLQTPKTAGLSLEGIDGAPKPPLPKPLRGLTHRPSGSAEPVVAAFGWSSQTPASPGNTQASHTTPEPAQVIAAPSQPRVSFAPIPSSSGPDVAPPKPLAIPAHPVSVPLAQDAEGAGEDDDDDDWGEMVSSPVVSSHTANGSAVPGFAAVPVSATPEPKTTDAKHFDAPPNNDIWGSVDFSLFDAAPAQPPPSTTPAVIASSTDLLAKGPPPTFTSEAPAASPTLQTAVPALSEPKSTDLSIIPTSPPEVLKVELPHTDVKGLDEPPQNDFDEGAQRIITNLPDLSYMLR